MKLLIDANLSWRLKIKLNDLFSEITHADELSVKQPVSDSSIWKHARENNLLIVTNDEDFMTLSILQSFPPKIILLKTRNQSTDYLAELIRKHIDDIKYLIESEDYGILELY